MKLTQGLRKRPTYDHLMDSLFHQKKIKYPNRVASNMLLDLVTEFGFKDGGIGEFADSKKQFNNALTQDQRIQEEVELTDRGAQADVDRFKTIYEARLTDPNYFLSGGSSQSYPITKQNKKR